MANNRVLYVEPNYTNSFSTTDKYQQTNVTELIPNPEDYCIAVDLAVEISGRSVRSRTNTNRSNNDVTEDNKVIIMSWKNNTGSDTVSFLQGTKIYFDSNKGESGGSVNSLTTSYTDIFYEDIKDNGTNEMFGISSIDINYNNYFVPQVTIQFVDIRGVSLFAPEELRHTNSYDGIGGFSREDIAGSFFKCFFTFPYPRFTLKVKGFYGEPVSYELTCSDFRANFDSNTGNFGATATFVGYSFSLLNDITLNTLAVAPISEYLGAEYWARRKNSAFKVLDMYGNEASMPTLLELIEQIKNIKGDLSKISQDNPLYGKQKNLKNQNDALNLLIGEFTKYKSNLITLLDKNKPKLNSTSDSTLFVNSNNDGFILFSNLSGDTIENYANVDESYTTLKNYLIEYNKTTTDGISETLLSACKGTFTKILQPNSGKLSLTKSAYEKASSLKIDDKINLVLSVNNEKTDNPFSNYIYGYIYDVTYFNEKLVNAKNRLQTSIEQNEKELGEFQIEEISKKINFYPSVQNVLKVIMAHLETLLHILFESSSSIVKNGRKLETFGLSYEMTDVNPNINYLPPFPQVLTFDKNGSKTEGWIGNLANSDSIEEKKVIMSLLNAVGNLQNTCLEAAEAMKNVNNTIANIPLTPMDMIITGNPFGSTINFDDISDFSGRIILRMLEVLSLPNFNKRWEKNADVLGKADAINFATLFKRPSNDFVKKLNSSLFNADFIIDIVSNNSNQNIQVEKINKKWAWDSNDSKDSVPLISKNTSKGFFFNENNQLLFECYKVIGENNMVSNAIIPIQTVTFDDINKDLKINSNNYATVPNNLGDYVTKSDYLNSDNKITTNSNLFVIDDNIDKYQHFVDQIQIEDTKTDSIREYFSGTSYDSSSYKKYYYTSVNTFGRTFLSENENKISFTPYTGNRLLFSSKRTESEIKENDVFNYVTKAMYPNFKKIVSYEEKANKEFSRSTNFTNDIFDNLDNINNYTIPSFAGYIIDNGRLYVSENVSLFGQYCYYLQSNKYTKSLMFLSTFNAIKLNQFIDTLCDENNSIFIAPKLATLLCGAYLWRYNEMVNNNNIDVIITDNDYFNINLTKTKQLNSSEISSKLFNLRNEIKQKLINDFKNWTDNEFTTIQKAFELKVDTGSVTANYIKWLAENLDGNWNDGVNIGGLDYNSDESIKDKFYNFEDYLTKTFSNELFSNYISIGKTENTKGNKSYSVKLYNRETSDMVINVTRLYITPQIIIKTTKYNLTNDESKILSIDNGIAKKYLTSFITELKNQYKDIYNSNVANNSSTVNVRDLGINDSIKLSLYKYCKLLYDRWIAGSSFDDWTVENFFDTNFYFIDSFYNKVGNEVIINIKDLYDRLVYSNTQETYSLLSFISDILSKNQFQFISVQNFADFANPSKMNQMFKPIPYIDMVEPKEHPDFIVMYANEPSRNLDIQNSNYTNDGFMLNADNDVLLPKAITASNNGYQIPAFGVAYGKQYQSYFVDIDVSMESPMVTEQSIKAQYLIAGQNNAEASENGRSGTFMGQDLFTIYSNNSYTCTIKMLGCAWIQPLMYFVLLNIPLFRGSYLIQKVTHHIEPGNMTTTITGTRMSANATPKSNQWYLQKANTESGPSAEEIREESNKLAYVGNDCEYKIYPTSFNGSEPVFNIDDLKNTTDLSWLEREGLKKDYSNLYEAIIATVAAEVGNGASEGELGTKLVVNVMINRCMLYGGWERVLAKNQTAVGVRTYAEAKTYSNVVKWTEEMLTQGPTSIIGKTTEMQAVNINKGEGPVYIWRNGVQTSELTKAKVITFDDVQKITAYCTTNGYGPRKSYNGSVIEYNPSWWRDAEYFLHHKNHIFTGVSTGKQKACWQIVAADVSKNESELSDLAKGVYRAIQQTAKSTDNVNVDINVSGKGNEMILTCTDNEKMPSIFDIVLNGYYNSFQTLHWVAKDSNHLLLNNPIEIRVVVKDNRDTTNFKRNVAVVVKNNSGKYEVVETCDNLSTLFYRSLSKKYKIASSNENRKIFEIEATNFVNNIDKAMNLLNDNQPVNCPTSDSSFYSFNSEEPTVDKNGMNTDLYTLCMETLKENTTKDISKTTYKDVLTKYGGTWNDKFQMFGVRSKNNMNGGVSSNKFIDICVIFYVGDDGKEHKFLAPFTTVPGLKVLTNFVKYNNSGAAILKEGYYPNSWKIGKHQGKYLALRQNKNLSVYRDNDKNNVYNYIGNDTGIFGINIHKSGNIDSKLVNTWSAGCQVFANQKHFEFMMSIVNKLKNDADFKDGFSYTLINENDLRFFSKIK
jgi:hypothetical protein